MNCDETRRHWNLYHDSEGDAELFFQVNEHLGNCAQCTEWFHQQSRLEDLIVEKMRSDAVRGPNRKLWHSVLDASGLRPARTAIRNWFLLGSALALAASLLLALALLWPGAGSAAPSLSRLAADYHDQFARGRQPIEFESRSDLDVEDYLLQRVSFPVRCPPREDSGFIVQGAGACLVEGSQAAYLVGQVDGRPVSIFILPRDALSHFPRQRQALQRERTHICREGSYEMVMAEIDRSVVVVIGRAGAKSLRRVLQAYGTYPHAEHHG